MQRRLAGYFGAETKTPAAVNTSLLRHRSQRVALRVIAGSAAWATGHPRRGNSDDAHGLILWHSSLASIFILQPPSVCCKLATIHFVFSAYLAIVLHHMFSLVLYSLL